MLNQNLLNQSVIGTYIEKQKIVDVALKLGQYMYVVKSQIYPEIQMHSKKVMKTFSIVIEQVLIEIDVKITNKLNQIC